MKKGIFGITKLNLSCIKQKHTQPFQNYSKKNAFK